MQEAARKMSQGDLGVLPVCDTGRLVGIVTDRDITVESTAGGQDPKSSLVEQVMKRDLVYCSEEQDVGDAAKLMEQAQVRRLPVLDSSKQLVGIVSLGDLAVRAGNQDVSGEALEGVSQPARNGSGRKHEYVSALDSAYSDFLSQLEDLDERAFDTKWIDGRWGVREVAAHFAGWHGQFAGGLERIGRGEPARSETTDWRDVDGLNRTFAEHAKGKRKEEVLLELDQAVRKFKNAAAKLPEELFEEQGIVAGMFRNAGFEHMREHTAMVREWRATKQ
jgi:hypothetical protein